MNLKFSLILAFVFAALTRAEETTTTTCLSDLQCTECLCASANDTATFATGDTTTICAHFVAVNKTTGCIVAQRAAFPVKVDTFSSIMLNGSQAFFQQYGYVALVIQAFGTVKSYNLTYFQGSEFYSNKFSVVIQLSGGVIQSAIWDHQCATCDGNECYKFSMPNGTLIDSICNNPSCLSVADGCDPQIYVTWVGSDKNGAKLTSAGMRLSRFEQFSVSDLLDAKTIPAYVIPNNTSPPNQTETTNPDPTTPTNPSTPTTPTDPTHTNSSNTTTPTTPTNSSHTNSSDPTTPTNSSHTNSSDPTTPTNSSHTNSSDPTTPTTPTDPTHTNSSHTNSSEPTTPTTPTDPGHTTTDPSTPTEPTDPGHTTTDPSTPTEPTDPGHTTTEPSTPTETTDPNHTDPTKTTTPTKEDEVTPVHTL